MDHPVTTARLVKPGELEGRGVTAVLDRAAIEETLRSEERDQLLLDVARGTNGEVETHVVRVDLGREDLERILAQAEGDRVALDFDRAELEAVLGADVEAHSLRERALVLTVAAATAAGAAGGASGAIPHGGGSTGSEAPFGAVAASGQDAPATVIGAAGEPAEAPFGAVAASGQDAPATVIGAAGEPAEAPFGAVAASGRDAPATVIGGAGEPAAVPAAEPGPVTPTARLAGSELEPGGSPDPAVLAGIAGGLGALAITAAAFVRRREQEPRFS
jgi:hypothetical protein